MYELQDIKRIRKKLNMTQFGLAKRANVSQSLIAKIEAGKIDPTFTKVKQIFLTLDDLERKQELSAHQLMNQKIISVNPHTSIKEAVQLMRKHQISQMPVIHDQHATGLISESSLLDALVEGKKQDVKDIMTDAPPVVSKNAHLLLISTLLRHAPMLLVADKGVFVGVITKSDVLGKAYSG